MSRSLPLRVFYGYSRQDEPFRAKLEAHLGVLHRLGLIEGWHEGATEPGREWAPAVRRRLEEADIVVLLVSADFLSSDTAWSVEMRSALQRHWEGLAHVLPVLVRPVDLIGAPFAELQSLPETGGSIATHPNEDEAWAEIAAGIRRIVTRLSSAGPVESPPVRPLGAPTAASLRTLLGLVLSPDDFEAFCSDHFPSIKARFTSGMQQVMRVTLLLEHAARSDVIERLREAYPAAVTRHMGVLRFSARS